MKRLRDKNKEGEPGDKKARKEDSQDSQDSQKTATTRMESVNNKNYQNVPNPNLNFPLEKINQKSPKFVQNIPPKPNVKKIINYFEKTVCNTGEIKRSKANSSPGVPTNNSKLILFESKATPSQPSTTTTTQQGIKQLRGKKLVPPQFKFKKISEYFASKLPKEDKKSDLTPN